MGMHRRRSAPVPNKQCRYRQVAAIGSTICQTFTQIARQLIKWDIRLEKYNE